MNATLARAAVVLTHRRRYPWRAAGLLCAGLVAGISLRGAASGAAAALWQLAALLLAVVLVWGYVASLDARVRRLRFLERRAALAVESLVCPTVPAPSRSLTRRAQRQIKGVLHEVTRHQVITERVRREMEVRP